MTSDDRVIVIGGGDAAVSRPDPTDRGGRSPLWSVVPILALFAALIAFIVVPQDRAPTDAEPQGLEPPAEPPRAFVSTTTAPPEVPGLGVGWRQARLIGAGVAVTSVDHGPDGWLAASSRTPVVAHVSQNAVLWEAHTVHGLEVEDPIAAVGEGLMAIFGSDQWREAPGAARPVGAVSTDSGATWESVEYQGLLVVEDVAVLDGRVFIAGSTGSEPGFSFQNLGTAALWEVVDGTLVAWDLTGGDGSALSALEVDGDTLVAYGHSSAGAVIWTLGDPVPTVVETIRADRRFVDVERTPDGWMAAVGFQDQHTATDLYTSADGTVWTPIEEPRAPNVTGIAVYGRDLLGTVDVEGRFWARSTDLLFSEHPEVVTGWESAHGILDIESDGELLVMAGVGEGGGTLYVRGTVVTPVEVAAVVPSDQPRWRTLASVSLDLDDHLFLSPFGVASAGDVTFVATPGQVFKLTEADGRLSLVPSVYGVTDLGNGPGLVWAAAEGGDARLFVHLTEGVWTVDRIPLDQVASAGRVDGDLVVTGWDGQGPLIIRPDDGGEWSESRPGDDALVNVEIVQGGFVGDRHTQADDGAPLGVDVVFSADGTSWELVEGWDRYGGELTGRSFLINRDDPSRVAMADDLPDLRPIQTPAENPTGVAVWEETLYVSSRDAIHVRDPDGDWSRLPVDLEHGAPDQTAILPGTRPRLAMIDHTGLRILEWR